MPLEPTELVRDLPAACGKLLDVIDCVATSRFLPYCCRGRKLYIVETLCVKSHQLRTVDFVQLSAVLESTSVGD